MVGVLQQRRRAMRSSRRYGLYRVAIGNYMGQNFGLITLITDSQIQLRELIQDAVATDRAPKTLAAAGSWREVK